MRAAFEGDLVVSGEITLHEWQRRGMVVRLKEVFGLELLLHLVLVVLQNFLQAGLDNRLIVSISKLE